MTVDLQGRCLYRGPLARVRDYRCRALSPERSAEEYNTDHAIVLPRAGLFVRHARGEAVVGDANQVMFFQAGEPYRVSHPVGCGDRCTSIGLPERTLAMLLADHDPGAMERRDGPFRLTHAPTTPGADLDHRRLLRSLSASPARDLGHDESLVSLLQAVVAAAYAPPTRRRARPGTERAHRDLTERARLVLAGWFRAPVALDDVARAVHSSPFHLARVFRTCAGMSMHRYQTRLRLRAALEELADARTPPAVAALATRLGFYDQAHFANAFRAELGLSPSRWAREATAVAARRMSRILQD